MSTQRNDVKPHPLTRYTPIKAHSSKKVQNPGLLGQSAEYRRTFVVKGLGVKAGASFQQKVWEILTPIFAFLQVSHLCPKFFVRPTPSRNGEFVFIVADTDAVCREFRSQKSKLAGVKQYRDIYFDPYLKPQQMRLHKLERENARLLDRIETAEYNNNNCDSNVQIKQELMNIMSCAIDWSGHRAAGPRFRTTVTVPHEGSAPPENTALALPHDNSRRRKTPLGALPHDPTPTLKCTARVL